MKQLTIILGLVLALASGCAARGPDRAPLTTVDSVDLQRYLGKWYEIASYPAWFARGCTATTAEYSLLPDGNIEVINRCRKGNIAGPVRESKGRAQVVDTVNNTKLAVTFFPPFKGDYWIIDLDEDYQWAVVGVPDRDYLWILSRTPTMDAALYAEIQARVAAQGFDPLRLQKTPQLLTDGRKDIRNKIVKAETG